MSPEKSEPKKKGVDITPDGTLEKAIVLSPEEKKLEEARNAFIEEYKKNRSETKKKVLIEKTKASALNLLAGTHNIFSKDKKELKKINEEDYYSESYREAKKKYDESRIVLGNSLFDTQKEKLTNDGLSGKDLEQKLQEYKGSEILNKVIIEERQKIIDAKADQEQNNKKLWKKTLDWYLGIKPAWKRVALSTAVFLPAAASGAFGASIVAGYGIAGLAGINFAKSMAVGSLVGHLSKGIDLLKRKSDETFKGTQAQKELDLRERYSKGEIHIDEFESQYQNLEKENQKRARNRALTKMAVGVALGAGASFATQIALGSALENAHVTPPEHTPTPIEKPDTSFNPEETIGKGEGVTHPIKRQIERMLQNPEDAKRLGYTGGDVHKFAMQKAAEIAKENGYIHADGSEVRLNESAIGHASYRFDFDQNGKPKIHEFFDKKEMGSGSVNSYEYETKPKINEHNLIKTKPLVETPTNGAEAVIPNNPQVNISSQFENTFSQTEIVHGIPRNEFYQEITHHLEGKGVHWESKADYDAEMWKWEKFGNLEKIDQGGGHYKIRFYSPEDNIQWKNVAGKSAESLMGTTTGDSAFVGRELTQLREHVFQSTDIAIDPIGNEGPEAYVKRLMHALEGDTQDHVRPFGQNIEEGSASLSVNQENNLDVNNQVNNPTSNEEAVNVRQHGAGEHTQSKNEHFDSNAKEYTTEKEVAGKPIHPERYRDHVNGVENINRRDVVVGKSPQVTNHDGISYKNWNKATDKMFDNSDFQKEYKFSSYNAYERDRELQNIFGWGKQENGQVTMEFFRDRDEWQILQKMPAKYLLDINNNFDKIPSADLQKLIDSGVVTDNPVIENGQTLHDFSLTNKAELTRLMEAYGHVRPEEMNPYPNETIEQYVERMTKDVHQADDGTFFARKNIAKTDWQNNRVEQRGGSMGGQRQRGGMPFPPFGQTGGGVISPTRGVYNTGGVPPIMPTRGVYNTGGGQFTGNQGGPFYEPGFGGVMGMPNGANLGQDATIGAVNVANTAINEGVMSAQGASDGMGAERILATTIREGVRIGINGLLRSIGGQVGGGNVWR